MSAVYNKTLLHRLIKAEKDITLLRKKCQGCIQKQKTCKIIENLLNTSLGYGIEFSFSIHEYKSNAFETNSYQIASYGFLQTLMPKFLQSNLMPNHTKVTHLLTQFLKCADLMKYFGLTKNFSNFYSMNQCTDNCSLDFLNKGADSQELPNKNLSINSKTNDTVFQPESSPPSSNGNLYSTIKTQTHLARSNLSMKKNIQLNI